ncbi:MAG: carbohydrate kinase [Clostridia bacterium]
MKKYDITAFGEILIDFTYIKDSEENQKLFAQNAGGAPANVLVCATKLGCQTAFLGKVGKDMHGDFLRKTLENENVNVNGLISDENYFTTLAFVDLNDKGERSFSFARKHGADTFMKVNEIDLETIKNSKIFHIGSLSLTTEFIKGTTLYAVVKAKESGTILSYDPNYRASLWESREKAEKEIRLIIPFADIMKISDEECELVTGKKDPELAAKYLIEQGVQIVCVTLGENGVLVANKKNSMQVSGFKPKQVADTTGAGDSFWGAFLSKVVKTGKDLDKIPFENLCNFAKFANATASLCVEKTGAIRAMPSLEQVNSKILDI